MNGNKWACEHLLSVYIAVLTDMTDTKDYRTDENHCTDILYWSNGEYSS